MKIKMFNENDEIEIVEVGSERYKTLWNLVEIALKELDIRALKKENEILNKALDILIENIELESCVYCPCKQHYYDIPQKKDFSCKIVNDGCKECLKKIKNYFREQAKENKL